MRVPGRRRSAAAVAVLSAVLILTIAGPATQAGQAAFAARIPVGAAPPEAQGPAGLSRFMYAVGQVESGGRYTARNPTSGAYGKYQIMPSNWPSWAQTYLGDRNAKQTPANQEKVAAGKFTTLHRSLRDWRRVAYWWLTGSSRKSGWSAYATRYVNKVMGKYGNAPTAQPPAARHIAETSPSITWTGPWKSASYGSYAGGKVRYSNAKGAGATLTFTGRAIAWYGPAGPTRGKAWVFIDGKYARTADFHRSGFKARVAAFRMTWPDAGKHTIRIEVVGTAGHPMVAIDEFVVVP